MTVFLACCGSTLRSLAWPLVAAVAGCLVALVSVAFDPDLDAVSSGYWLHLPGLLLTATGLAAALESWPLFSRERPGHEWLRRLENGPLHGCLAASLGALTALALTLLAAGAVFPVLQAITDSSPGAVQARIGFRLAPNSSSNPGSKVSSSSPYSSQRQPRLRYVVDSGGGAAVAVERLEIRPTAILSKDHTRPVDLRVFADGQALHPTALSNLGDVIRLTLTPPRPVRRLEIVRDGRQGVILYLPAAMVEGFSTTAVPRSWNGALAALSYLLPALLAFATMIVGHTRLALPVNFTAGLGVFLLVCLTETTPHGRAIAAFARNRYLGSEGLSTAVVTIVATFATVVTLTFGLGKILDRIRSR